MDKWYAGPWCETCGWQADDTVHTTAPHYDTHVNECWGHSTRDGYSPDKLWSKYSLPHHGFNEKFGKINTATPEGVVLDE